MFKVGDRVVATAEYDNRQPDGEGTVIDITKSLLTVQFDTPDEYLHDGFNSCGKDHHCWCYNVKSAPGVLALITLGTESNPLYHYRASEETGTDAWSTLVVAVHGLSWDDAKEKFKEWEHEYKVTTSLPVPAAWRSAKSVIKGAINNDVPLMTEAHEARGKTAVEKDIKAKKLADKEELSPEDKARKLADKLMAFCVQHNMQGEINMHYPITQIWTF